MLKPVAVEPGLGRLDGHVDGGEGDVTEPGPVAALDPVPGGVGDEVRHVPGLFDQLAVAVPGDGKLAPLVAMVIRVNAAGQAAVAGIEAVGLGAELRCRTEVPLAEQPGVVSLVAQHGGQGGVAIRQDGRVRRYGGVGAKTPRMPAGEQRRAGGRTHRADVVLGQLHASLYQPVNVRRADRRAVAAHVSPAEVISEDVQDVRPAHRASWSGHSTERRRRPPD